MWERKYRGRRIWVEFFLGEDLGSQDKRKPFGWGVGDWDTDPLFLGIDHWDEGWSSTLRAAMKAAERSVDDTLKRAS